MTGTVYVTNVRRGNRQRLRSKDDTLIYVGRPSALGNPYPLTHEGDRLHVVWRYAQWLNERYRRNTEQRKQILAIVDLVKAGHDVALNCWCHPKPCHGDIIATLVRNIILCEDL